MHLVPGARTLHLPTIGSGSKPRRNVFVNLIVIAKLCPQMLGTFHVGHPKSEFKMEWTISRRGPVGGGRLLYTLLTRVSSFLNELRFVESRGKICFSNRLMSRSEDQLFDYFQMHWTKSSQNYFETYNLLCIR